MKLYVPQQIYFKFSGYSRNIKIFFTKTQTFL